MLTNSKLHCVGDGRHASLGPQTTWWHARWPGRAGPPGPTDRKHLAGRHLNRQTRPPRALPVINEDSMHRRGRDRRSPYSDSLRSPGDAVTARAYTPGCGRLHAVHRTNSCRRWTRATRCFKANSHRHARHDLDCLVCVASTSAVWIGFPTTQDCRRQSIWSLNTFTAIVQFTRRHTRHDTDRIVLSCLI